MSPFPLSGRTLLIRDPLPDVSERIHVALEAGALVTVSTPAPDAPVLDLASRGLITVVDQADPTAFDIVVRDAGTHDQPAPTSDTDGTVTLVGGGPGSEGLLTLAGMQAIREADVLVCDRLAPLGALREAKPDARVIHVGKIPRGEFTPQEAINAILVEHATAGRNVVRLKGGDSFVFGRGGEEWNACVEAGLAVRVIPGVTSAIAAAELAGVPVTHRGLVQGFVVVSGHVGPDDERGQLNWTSLVESGLTIVVLMGVAALDEIVQRLIAEGLAPDTPAACIADASLPSQRQVYAPVADLAAKAAEAGISAPAVTVIGEVVEALHR